MLALKPGTGALTKVLPYLTVVIAAFAPLATGIYLLTSLTWSLGERRFFFRRSASGQTAAAQPVRPGLAGQKAR